MKIAIHHQPNSFSDRWILYCRRYQIPIKIVNCYDTDIIEQLKDCDALMWHFHHDNYRDALFAKQLLFSIEHSGKKTFPSYKTCWHFDDKVGQKYLLEMIGAPLVPSYVFYEKKAALKWIEAATFPKVFKLRGGSGSQNVLLISTPAQARKIVKKAFGRGFPQFNRIGYLKEKIRRYKEGKEGLLAILKGLGRLIIPTEFAKMHSPEKGYIYFQDYFPGNEYDIRVIVIEEKAFAIKRLVRKNDFRASGSGNILYEKEHFNSKTIELAFQLSELLNSQCIAFDFIFDEKNNPFVVEISYGFATPGYDSCVGYWDKELNYHEGKFVPQEWMVSSLMNEIIGSIKK